MVTLNILEGEHRSGEFPKINPRMIVPTIVDDDFVLCESKAILMYLPSKMGMCKGRSVYPKCPKARAIIHQRLLFDSTDFYSIVSGIIEMSFSDQALLTVEHKKSLTNALNTMQSFLQGNEFFCGSSTTLADFAFCSSVAMLMAIGFNIDDDFPLIAEWFERMQSLKGFNELSAGAQQFGKLIQSNLKNSFGDL